MFKVEDFQSYGKEQFEQCVASATSVQHGLQAIASAYGDYTKSRSKTPSPSSRSCPV
ncbi:hypothetical protein ACVIHA_009172 [Bradyrhizobium liaoningense]